MTSNIAEPAPKKRRSKWDVVATETETTTTAAAAVAAAKINAMLAAQGKLAKSDNVILPPTTPTPALGTMATPIFTIAKTTLLTPPPNVAPLYSTPSSSSSGHQYIQEKVFVGLEEASSSFNAADRLKGPDNSYLNHISAQTGGKAFLRGKGSKFIEPTSGKESFEALHVFISHTSQEGLNNARKLCQSLIDTVKKDYEQFKSSQSGPLGFGGGYSNSSRPVVNPYSLHHPGYHGYNAPPQSHPPYYGPPAHGPPGYNYPPPPGPAYPPPPGPGGYYGPPHPYPPPPISHPPAQDVRSGPPNAFTDYRTYDKVAVTSTDDPAKRNFTEEVESGNETMKRSFTEVPPTTHHPPELNTKATKRSFVEAPPTTDFPPSKRKVSDELPSKRRFMESVIDGAEPPTEQVTEDPVGKWQNLSQPAIIKPVGVISSSKVNIESSADPANRGKELMPPPSLPGGLKGIKSRNKPHINNLPPPPTGQPSNGKEEGAASHPAAEGVSEVKAPGLSLLAHYADDSDSDNDG